jgi:hypothetical protein
MDAQERFEARCAREADAHYRVGADDDYDPAADAELIPLAWLESLTDAATSDDEDAMRLGFVPMANTGPMADAMRDRIAECSDAHWLLVLALTSPAWAEPAMRQLAELCKATATWANWLQDCQDKHDALGVAA